MQYVLEPAFEETGSVVIDVGDLQAQMVGPAPSSSSPELTALFYGIVGKQNNKPVQIALMFNLRSFFLQMKLDDGDYLTVDVSSEALRLRHHLLGQTFLFWHSLRETDSLGPETLLVCRAGLAEMKRIEELNLVAA